MMSDTDFERLKELASNSLPYARSRRKLADFLANHAYHIVEELQSRRRMVSLFGELMSHIDPVRTRVADFHTSRYET